VSLSSIISLPGEEWAEVSEICARRMARDGTEIQPPRIRATGRATGSAEGVVLLLLRPQLHAETLHREILLHQVPLYRVEGQKGRTERPTPWPRQGLGKGSRLDGEGFRVRRSRAVVQIEASWLRFKNGPGGELLRGCPVLGPRSPTSSACLGSPRKSCSPACSHGTCLPTRRQPPSGPRSAIV
jgi:hypothetical protein